MTMPDEAVQAAVDAYGEEAKKEINYFPVMMRAALTAALPFLTGAPSPRAQALEEAAQVADKGNTGWLKKRDVTANKKEARDYETMAIACSHVAAAIRALSSQPVADGWLPMDHPDLPDDGTSVILATTGGHVGEAVPPDTQDDDDDWYWCGAACRINKNHKPIAWRPLPASPGASE